MTDSCIAAEAGSFVFYKSFAVFVAEKTFIRSYPDVSLAVFADCINTGVQKSHAEFTRADFSDTFRIGCYPEVAFAVFEQFVDG